MYCIMQTESIIAVVILNQNKWRCLDNEDEDNDNQNITIEKKKSDGTHKKMLTGAWIVCRTHTHSYVSNSNAITWSQTFEYHDDLCVK